MPRPPARIPLQIAFSRLPSSHGHWCAGLIIALGLGWLGQGAGAESAVQTYTVKPGDTAYSVARLAGTDLATLLKLNGLSVPDLKPGQVLKLPAGPAQPVSVAVMPRTHTVEAGQTLYSVARQYGLKAADLQEFNHLSSPDLRPGQVLTLPGLGVTGPGVTGPSAARPLPAAPAASVPAVRPPLPASPPTETPARHTVQPGQTLYGIARLYNLRPEDLLTLNHLPSGDLHPGQVLLLPPGVVAQSAPSLPSSTLFPASAVPGGALLSPGVPLPAPPGSPALPAPNVPRSDAPQVPAAPVATTNPDQAVPAGGWRGLAMSLLGVPYAYGGQSRSGTDCSGLVVQVFGPLGLRLPRQSALQAQAGTFVAQADLQAGDLVFFDTEGRGEVTHVGIYLGDYQGMDGAFINASSFGGQVAVNRLSEKYFAQRYLWARRVLGVLAQGH